MEAIVDMLIRVALGGPKKEKWVKKNVVIGSPNILSIFFK